MIEFSLLSFLFFFFPITSCLATPLCHPNESSALLSFKNSFTSVTDNRSFAYCANEFGNVAKPNSTVSWEMGSDCCGWSGVTCDEVTGFVIGLHLKCGELGGLIDSENSLFSLTHIRILDLSGNPISGPISPNFGRLSGMVELDLSFCYFHDQVPFELAYLSNLKTLDLHWNDLRLETNSLKQIVANLTKLEVLSLDGVDLSVVFPNSFTNLSTSLTSLYLGSTGLSGELPENIFRLSKLYELDLSFNEFTGLFPKYNWTSSLRSLDLSYNRKLVVSLSNLKQNFKNLKALYVGNSKFSVKQLSVVLDSTRQVTSLGMSSNNFSGQIPWEYLNLENLTYLDLSVNYLVGVLPEICKNIRNNSLYLCDPLKNQIIGPVPLKLKSLKLSRNLLNGTIPSWLYSLPSLHVLSLNNNHFSGQIKEFQFNSLEILRLRSNELHGVIPRSIFHQVNLSWLDLSLNNLSGVVKLEQFSKLKYLRDLSLSYNNLSLVSSELTNYTLPNLWYLDLASCNVSEFPYYLKSLENLMILDLSKNRIGGSVPEWFLNVGKDSLYTLDLSYNFITNMSQILWESLEYIDLRFNQLQGHLPIPRVSTIGILASNNQLSGSISSLICNLDLEVLDLGYNNLSGNIPPCIGNLSYLFVLDLRMNMLNGTLPSIEFGNFLMTLNVNGNQLEGSLPESLVNCNKLEVLDVGNNKLNGYFPQWLELLPKLQVLILRSNRFHGEITYLGVRFIPFHKLRVLDLSNNEFTGPLPTKYFENFVSMMSAHTNVLEYMEKDATYGYRSEPLNFFIQGHDSAYNFADMMGEQDTNVFEYRETGASMYYQDSMNFVIKGYKIEMEKIQKMFIAIDLSVNNFTGEIPDSIGKLKSLKELNLSHNSLTSVIPERLGNLSNLESLDLSSNELVGRIPWQLAAYLKQLQILNLSSNRLVGPIPRGSQFDTFNSESYAGNSGLCGFPLSESCSKEEAFDDEEEVVDDETMLDRKAVMMGYASGLVIGISLGYIMLFSRRFDYWLMERLEDRRLRVMRRRRRTR